MKSLYLLITIAKTHKFNMLRKLMVVENTPSKVNYGARVPSIDAEVNV